MSDLPVVCVFGAEGLKLMSAQVFQFEARDLDCRCYPDDSGLDKVLAKDRPMAVVSVGDRSRFKRLEAAPSRVREMWRHYDSVGDLDRMGVEAFDVFSRGAVSGEPVPLVSVFTPAYRSGGKISRPMMSLLSQTLDDWEWVVLDDSDDGGVTFDALSKMAEDEPRMRVYRESRRSGRIGNVKRSACGLCRGRYLVELDHDDELVPEALALVAKAFGKHQEAGFVYTDCAESFEDGRPLTYPDGWGMGYGKYYDDVIGGVKYKVIASPNINAKTIRHIVAAPNHIRAWRKSFYDDIGGHRDGLHVADDYELVVRTFLGTRMVRIPRMCYLQYRNEGGNTQGVRNAEIQRLVRMVSMSYDRAIHDRFVQLGVDDFVWDGKEPSFFRMMRVPNPPVESHCTILFEDGVS